MVDKAEAGKLKRFTDDISDGSVFIANDDQRLAYAQKAKQEFEQAVAASEQGQEDTEEN